MNRPRIYGSETRCRAAVTRFIGRAEDLLDQAIGARNQMAALSDTRRDTPKAFSIESAWGEEVRRWFSVARRGMGPYLQKQFEDVLPVLSLGLPPDTGKSRHFVGLDNGEPWLRKALHELQELQAALGVRRGVATAEPPPARFEELRASGLVDVRVIADHANEMLSPRTPKQLCNAIGSAKELTEATLRAALDQLEEP
jgi:hypothetical protein